MKNKEFICFIVEKKNGKFKPQVAKVVDIDEDDSSLFIVANGNLCKTLKEAQEFVKINTPKEAEGFLTPIKSNECGGLFWLSQLKKANNKI